MYRPLCLLWSCARVDVGHVLCSSSCGARAKDQRAKLKERLDNDPVFARFMQQSAEEETFRRILQREEPNYPFVKSGPFSFIDSEIAEVKGLLKKRQNSRKSGGTVNPE